MGPRNVRLACVAVLALVAGGCSENRRFIVAARDGDVARVRSMLEKNPALLDAGEIDDSPSRAQTNRDTGFTALHAAAGMGRQEVVELLIARGAAVDPLDDHGDTPLKLAALRGHRQIAELLLARGASLEPGDPFGKSPLYMAAAGGHAELASMLIARGARVDARTVAFTRVVGMETFSGGTTKVTDASRTRIPGGCTPLMIAAQNGHADTVRLLISAGANVDLRDEEGWTALHVAAANGRQAVAELLVTGGADATARNVAGQTPLDLARARKHGDVAEVLGAQPGAAARPSDSAADPGAAAATGTVFPVHDPRDRRFLRRAEGARLGNTRLPSGTLVPQPPGETEWRVRKGRIVLEATPPAAPPPGAPGPAAGSDRPAP